MIELNKIYNEDCLIGMKKIKSDSIDLIATSPPYYNARAYSQWETFDDYMQNMTDIFKEAFRVTKNYHNIVVNVSDVIGKTKKTISSQRKLALGAYFIVTLEKIGFRYVDDIIWDKGEVQSKRNFVGENYPYQKYPINCYEHILIFKKIVDSDEKPSCPECNMNKVVINGRVNGVVTYECKNQECSQKSPSGRGKRFSISSKMLHEYQTSENEIEEEIVKMWRKDIIKLSPVIKINNKGVNTLKHTAPFPKEIPEMAISYYTGVGDVVMDIFMGSGTTAITAKNLNRNYLGFELNNEYYNVSLERIKNND